jgi:transcriptional regulator with XRE-family HTH domain
MIDRTKLLLARIEIARRDWSAVIVELRRAGLTTSDIADACERTRSWVWRVETGELKNLRVEQAEVLEMLQKLVIDAGTQREDC